ncbi:YcgN family cysteine cluster protein [Kozakia baliensis]|uniref:UPF0260 protein A0U89_10685 n=1 Tax=Kozakia baliensis TaxID=153496 RepID=A0A1D8UV65_9PROT|nr:YcgN family cysteine cluster protein [Kozakia baliensis]AOX17532.1 hypothetical protein A0U89_10685 [Kozakia baliensis]
MTDDAPFWKRKSLGEMTKEEWESLCDGCGRCCLHKLRDDETDEIHYTNVACRLLDLETCRCSDYMHRFRKVRDCVSLTPALMEEIDWLPPTCGYRLVHEGRDLPEWHPLRSGNEESVHQAHISGQGRIVSERRAGALEDYVADWPGEYPSSLPLPPLIRRHKP